MAPAASILIFAGSSRKDALSGRLARAASLAVEDLGATSTLVNLRDYPAAVYNGDDEDANGVPQSMQDLTGLIRKHDGLIIVTPEYNGFFTPLLKNTLDWCSRPGASPENPSLPRGKPVCILASAPGAIGGMRAIPRLRDYLSELGMLVSPEVQAVGHAAEAFGADGRLADDKQRERVAVVVGALLHLTRAAST